MKRSIIPFTTTAHRLQRRSLIGLFFSLAVAASSSISLAADHVYFADFLALRRSDLTGANQAAIWGISTNDIAVDANYIYWGDNSTGNLMRGSLDGSGTPTVLLTAPGRIDHIEIDAASNMIYWDDIIASRIYRASTTPPQSPAVLLPLTPLSIHDIALDLRPSSRHLYYTDGTFVYRSNLDGTSPVQLENAIGPDIQGIAIDTCRNYIYAVGKTFPHPGVPEHFLRRAKLSDCSNLVNVLIAPAGYPGDVGLDPHKIVIDPYRRQMYWTAETGDLFVRTQVHKANLDGTSPQVIVLGASTQRFRGIAIELENSECPPFDPYGWGPLLTWVYPGTFVAPKVTVDPGTLPSSTGVAVNCDLSVFGLSSNSPFFDDGTHSDEIAGDNIFTFGFTVPPGADPGARTLSFVVSDAQGRSSTGTFSLAVESPVICVNDLFQYSGPRNTAELATFLMTSQDPVILDLNSGVKQSLIEHMYFNHGIPRGMLGTDSNINELYASNAAAVFTAIYGMPTLVHTHATTPVVQDITRAQLIASHPGFSTVASYCENCDIPRCAGETCCTVPGAGCCDYFAMSGAQLFRVTDVSACSAYTPPCGNSDFNGDGDFGTDADIETFFACLGGNCCPTCYSGGSDFNGDGDYGTDADIEAFFRVLGGGSC